MTDDIQFGKEGGLLTAIEKGMNVIDSEGEEVGEVEFVYFGTRQVDDSAPGVTRGTAPAVPLEGAPHDSWVQRLGSFLDLEDAESFPEVVAERLLRQGFVRVDAGFLAGHDRFIFPEQITDVNEEGVHLRVERGDLVEGW